MTITAPGPVDPKTPFPSDVPEGHGRDGFDGPIMGGTGRAPGAGGVSGSGGGGGNSGVSGAGGGASGGGVNGPGGAPNGTEVVPDWVHTALNIGGLIPGIGAPLDILNAGIYAIEGNWLGAGLSLATAIPLIGDFAGLGRTAATAGEIEATAAKELQQILKEYGEIGRGEIKGEASVATGVRQLSRYAADLGDVPGTDVLALYNPSGEVYLQVFGQTAETEARTIVWEGQIGRVSEVPEVTAGTSGFGAQMEPKVREIIEQASGQKFQVKGPYAHGPDIVPLEGAGPRIPEE